MCSDTVLRRRTGAGDTGINEAVAGSLPGPHATDPGGSRQRGRRYPLAVLGGGRQRHACPIACAAAPTVAPRHPGGHVRIGIQASYSGGFQETAAEIRDLEAAGLDVAAVAEVYTFDAVSQLGYLAAVTERVELLSAHLPDLQPHARPDRDDRGRPRLRLRRPVHPRPGRLRPAGDRGLARRPLRRPAAAHAGDRGDLPAGVAPRAARPRRARSTRPAAGRPGHRPGQAAEADQHPGPRPDPGHARRARARRTSSWPPRSPRRGSRSSSTRRRRRRSGATPSPPARPSATRRSASCR